MYELLLLVMLMSDQKIGSRVVVLFYYRRIIFVAFIRYMRAMLYA